MLEKQMVLSLLICDMGKNKMSTLSEKCIDMIKFIPCSGICHELTLCEHTYPLF